MAAIERINTMVFLSGVVIGLFVGVMCLVYKSPIQKIMKDMGFIDNEHITASTKKENHLCG